jgi:hypothetical protein
MSEQLNYKVNVNTDEAVENVDELNSKLDQTNQATQKAQKNAKASAGAFASIGSTLKTLGVVGIVSKGFEFFTQILGKNQKVVDFVSTSVNFLTGVISDLVAFLVNNVDTVVNFFKDVFENPKKYIDQLATAIKNNLIERVNSAIKAFGFLGDIIKNVFTGNFEAAGESAKLFAKEMVDVATGVDNAFDKTTEALSELTEVAGEYFTKKLKQAQDLTDATNNAVLAEARMLNTIKQTEIAAEKLRQKRDDETLAIEERIAANDALLKVLESGQKQEIALLGIKANKINAEIALNGTNKELQAQLISLAGERADIEEKYTGFASEGLVNRNALLKEQEAITKSLAENENKLTLDREKATAELIKDEIEKLEVKKRILAEESQLELKRLQDNIDNTKAGTTARAEAEIAYSQKKNELAIQDEALDNQLQLSRLNREIDIAEKLRQQRGKTYDERIESIKKEQEILDQAYADKLKGETEYKEKSAALTLELKNLEEERFNLIKDNILQFKDSLIGVLSEAGKGIEFQQQILKQNLDAGIISQEEFNAQSAELAKKKAIQDRNLALFNIAVDTGVAIAGIVRQVSTNPANLTGVAYFLDLATRSAAVLANMLKAKNAIKSANISISGASITPTTSGGASSTAPITPQRPETATTNLSAQTINAIGNQAIRAYVVETDITSNQKRVQAIKQRARFS